MRLILLICLLTPLLSYGGDELYGSITVSEVTSIYDGDTFRANIKGWPPIVGERVPIRVANVDTPELRGKCKQEKKLARLAKRHSVALLRGAKEVKLVDMRRGKYFRIVANVVVDGQDLGNSLVKAGLGRSYSGGKREGWC